MPNPGGNGQRQLGVEMTPDLRKVAVDLAKFAPELKKQLRRRIRAGAVPARDAVKAAAAEFSTTIPAAIAIRSALTARRAEVWIIAARSKMPAGHEALAALQELGSKDNRQEIRHPTFGHEPWQSQRTHPYFYSTLLAHTAEMRAEVAAAADEALHAAGWRSRLRVALKS